MRIWALIAVAVSSVLPAGAGGQQTASKRLEVGQQIDVVANDYAFMPLPSRIASGPTVFTFSNQGKVQHEASLVRLKEGATIDDVIKTLKEGGRVRDIVERSVGILIAGGGKSPDGRLWVNLLAGRSYAVLCTLRDKPDAPPHAMLGMYSAFRVE